MKNFIFDIGNVLMSFDPFSYYLNLYNDTRKAKQIAALFTDEIWADYDRGIYDKHALIDMYKKTISYDLDAEEIFYNWVLMMKPMYETIYYMQTLKEQRYSIYILSNISSEGADYLRQSQPIFAIADGAVLSYEEKINKPDVRIYEILLERYGLTSNECFFIDDRYENIKTAERIGIHGIQFHNIQQLQQEVMMLCNAGEITC